MINDDIVNGKVDDEKAFYFITLDDFSSPLIIGYHFVEKGSTPATPTTILDVKSNTYINPSS